MIRFILTIAILYLLFRFIFRIVLPWAIASKVGKMHHQQNRMNEDIIEKKKKEEGKVSVEYVPNKKKTTLNDDGEYVDYEEVKE